MNLGTIPTDGGYGYEITLNPLIMQGLRRTTIAPFGRPVVNDVAPAGLAEYATTAAATAFAMTLKGRGAKGIAPAEEAATFVTDLSGMGVPKWEIVIAKPEQEPYRVNAGVIASILGDDVAFGYDAPTKAGKLAEALKEEYDAVVHVPLVAALRKAVGA